MTKRERVEWYGSGLHATVIGLTYTCAQCPSRFDPEGSIMSPVTMALMSVGPVA